MTRYTDIISTFTPSIWIAIGSLGISFAAIVISIASYKLTKKKTSFEQRLAGERVATAVRTLLYEQKNKLSEVRQNIMKWKTKCIDCSAYKKGQYDHIIESSAQLLAMIDSTIESLSVPASDDSALAWERLIAACAATVKETDSLLATSKDVGTCEYMKKIG